MDKEYNKIGFLSGSTLKIIACILMAIDHIGLELLPSYPILRIIGRLAFPLFAFFIAEGCRYTKNKMRRFFTLFTVGVIFMLFYYFYNGELYGNIFMTFSVSVLFVYLLTWCKRQIFCSGKPLYAIGAILIFAVALTLAYIIFDLVYFEYGFVGMLVPVLTALFDLRNISVSENIKRLDCHLSGMICFSLALIPLSLFGRMADIQFFCLFSIIPLIFYNGKPGLKGLKYSFYIFYPAHLIIIEGIRLLLDHL
jgi:hypothetical protein